MPQLDIWHMQKRKGCQQENFMNTFNWMQVLFYLKMFAIYQVDSNVWEMHINICL